jgi:hypothetical protein
MRGGLGSVLKYHTNFEYENGTQEIMIDGCNLVIPSIPVILVS